MKMLGRSTAQPRGCDDKGCSCNPAPKARRFYSRQAKRRERAAWKKDARRA